MSPFLTTLGGGSARGFGRARLTTVAPSGQQLYGTPGTYSFTVPAGVTSISACVVGGGGGSGYYSGPYYNSYPWGSGAGGGALAYANAVSVSPGDVLTVVVGAGGAPLTRFTAGAYVTAAESNASNKGGNSYVTLASSYIFVEAGGGKAPGSVNSPTLEGGGTDYAYNGGGGAFVNGTAGYSGGSGGSSRWNNSSSTGGGGGGAGGYTGAGGLGGLAAGAENSNNTGWRAGATSTGGGGGGGAGQGWGLSLPVGNRYPLTPSSGACSGYSNTNFTVGGGGGGVGLQGLGANGTGATMVGGGGGGGSGGPSALSPPNYGTANGAAYGGGAGGNDPGQYLFQNAQECYWNEETQEDNCYSTCQTVYLNSGTTSFVGGVAGGSGGVRIMWGTGRSYPSNAADV